MLPGPFDIARVPVRVRRACCSNWKPPRTSPPRPSPDGITVAELLLAYLDHAERHYRGHDGKPTSEIYEVKVVVRAFRELYADTPVAEFGPLCVKAARQKWVNEGRSRTECNRRVALVKRIFKWAVSEELAPAAVYQADRHRRRAAEGPDRGPRDGARSGRSMTPWWTPPCRSSTATSAGWSSSSG